MTHPPPCKRSCGKLYGVGVGPGDPELLTVKGLRLIREAAVIAFPAGIQGKPGVAEQIIAPWVRPEQAKLPLSFPYVQDEAELLTAWRVAADQVQSLLQQGQDVVFVSEGDVSFYSTFTYLAQMLQVSYPEVQIEAIPGISSPMAAAAVLGMPLTVRSQRLTVLPALYSVADLETALQTADVVVLMKVSSVYSEVWQVLHRHGLLQQSYIVERATQPNQVIHRNLSDRPQLTLPYFSILIIDCYPRKI